MTGRIIDKSILFLVLIALLFTSGMSVTGMVVAVLLILFAGFATDLFRKDIFLLGCGVTAVILFLVLKRKEIAYTFPMIAYSYASSKEYLFRKGRKASDIVFSIAEAVMVIISCIPLIPDVPLIIVTVTAVPMGLRWAYRDERQRTLASSLNDARSDVFDTEKKRKQDREKEDEKIYLATLEERNRIAREIHDNIGHMLTRSLVQMEAIKVINKDEDIAPMLDSVGDTMNEAMTAVRKSVHELHSESIDISIGINDIVKTLPERFSCKVDTMIESSIPNETKNAVLAILKEAVTNIIKYSTGDKVRVEFIENKTFWRLLVEDNGKNKDMTYDRYSGNEGIGLDNIITRCESLGGRANISADRSGFRVRVMIPKKG